MAVLAYLQRFTRRKRLRPPFNIVVFLDFDTSHAIENAQNHIRQVGRISRCYHSDGRRNDCLQCCDLLLGVASRLYHDPMVQIQLGELRDHKNAGGKLRDSQVKQYLVGLLGEMRERNQKPVRLPVRDAAGEPRGEM